MKRSFLFFCLFFLGSLVVKAQTYPEVWFENSELPFRYSNSTVYYEGNSWVKNRQHQVPVSDSIFFTPNNALDLTYTSAEAGNWFVDLRYGKVRAYRAKENSIFTFKVLVRSTTELSEWPALSFIQADSSVSQLIPLSKYIQKIEKSDWLSVEIPLQTIEGLNLEKGIHSIRFVQNSSDGKEHQLILDQFEVMPNKVPRSPLTSAAVLADAVGFERHVDLTWTLPFTPSIRYVKIYRSEDNKNFHPVAVRPSFVKKYSDIVPENHDNYFYKVSWVDYKYKESPLSNTLEAKTKKLTDEELLAMVREATLGYFSDGEEFNSGMQLKNISTLNSLVSVKNTGAGILALISEVKDDADAREKLFKRLEKIVTFLERADRVHGVYPELINGRTGKSSWGPSEDRALVVDLESTGILMQALLVAKEYFGQASELERQLRTRIDNLWQAVEWRAFVKEGEPYLYSHWSSQEGLAIGAPLSGLGKRVLYIMALASPEYAIEKKAYQQVVLNPLKIRARAIMHMPDSALSSVTASSESMPGFGLEYYVAPYVNNNIYYGLRLAVGSKDDALEEILTGFMALDPRGLQDAYASYNEVIKNLIHIQNRQSMEENLPLSSPHLLVSNGIAIYPFDRQLALANIRNYYLKHPETLWTEYGFVRAIDFQNNKITYPVHDFENGLNTIMINNGESGLIWNLFGQEPGIKEVLESLFEK